MTKYKIKKTKKDIQEVEIPTIIEAVATKSGNSAVITLPKTWLGKRIEARLIGD